MRYLFLVRVDPERAAKMTTADGDRMREDTVAWVSYAESRKARIIGDRVQTPEKARIVRDRGGKITVTDGPFVESKEQIAGFDVMECRDLEEAVEIASRHPVTRIGAIEVRELWSL